MNDAWPLVVVGGGITGLSAAHRGAALVGRGNVRLLEAQPSLGGKAKTEQVDGFLVEAGPDAFLARRAEGLALCRSLGLADRLIGAQAAARAAYVVRSGRLHPLPAGLSGLVPARLGPLLTTSVLSIPGRLRALLEPVIPRRAGQAEESVASFATRRFGREAYDWIVEPLLAGVFAGDGRVLSIQATFPQLAEAERRHGSVLRGAARALPTGDRRGFVTLPQGLGELVSALTTELGDVVRARSRVTALTSSGDGYRLTLADGTTLTAESVVLAVDASAASAMVAGIDAHLAGLLRRFAAVPVATVSLGFRTPSFGRALRGSGVLWPSVEGGALVAASWSSNKFAGRAPDAAVLVRGFFGRAGHEAAADQPDDILIADLRDVLRRLTGSSADPVLARVHRPVGGMPQYTMGHAARVGAVRDRLAALPGVAVAGASFDGVGIPACIASAWAAVDQVLSAARVPT